MLTLSLFPGIGLLDRAFEAEGFCIVRGPDALWGGDIRAFHPPAGRFDGIIGGPPCQDFSSARRCEPTGNGLEMLSEFRRVVTEAQPDWWLMENVPAVPDMLIPGYNWQRLDLRASEFGLAQRRLRHIQFGSRRGNVLVMERHATAVETEPAVMATDMTTPWDRFCVLQGLPADFDIPAFTVGAKREAVGNGVPLPMGRALAQAVRGQVQADRVSLCACRCGRPVVGRVYHSSACRMRAMRRRREGGGYDR